MAVRTVRFRPLILDGSGDPAIARGTYLITPFNSTAYGDLGQLLQEPGLTVAISGAAVPKDLPVVEAGDHNCLVVTGFFGPNARAPFRPSSVEYVFVPAGGSVIDYEDLPRVLPSTLGPVPDAPESEWELRLTQVEDILAAGGGSGGGAPAGGGTGGAIRPEDLQGITAIGILLDKPSDALAARNAISAGTSNLAIGTSGTTAAQGDRAALKDATQSINAVWTFATDPVFNVGGIAQASVNGLTAFVSSVNAFIAGGPAPLASPIFTGNPQAPTPLTADSDTSIATTAHVHAVAQLVQNDVDLLEAGRGAAGGYPAMDSLGVVRDSNAEVLATQAFVDERFFVLLAESPQVPANILTLLEGKVDDAEMGNVAYKVIWNGVAWSATRPAAAGSRPIEAQGGPIAPAWLLDNLGDVWLGTPLGLG